jgi:hypothetical protein
MIPEIKINKEDKNARNSDWRRIVYHTIAPREIDNNNMARTWLFISGSAEKKCNLRVMMYTRSKPLVFRNFII